MTASVNYYETFFLSKMHVSRRILVYVHSFQSVLV
jgi:hypothetical protein